MSKAEEFISDCTKNCSNEIIGGGWTNGEFVQIFNPWLTPEQARRAVEIAREEIINKTLDFLKDKLYDSSYIGIIDLCDEYIKTMKEHKNE